MANTKKKQEKCECCCCGDEEKSTNAYFCPKCKSTSVKYVFGLKNIFGIIPTMKCQKCGFQLRGGFPQIEISKNKLRDKKR